MTEAELKNKINDLRDHIAQHQTEIHRQERRQAELTKPPVIPAGATGQQLAKIFGTHAGFDDQILGVQAAIIELNRRMSQLHSQLEESTTALERQRQETHRKQISAQVLAEINN